MSNNRGQGPDVYMPKHGAFPNPIQIEMERYEVEHEKRLKAEAEAAVLQRIAMAFAGILTLMSIVIYLFPVR
jgi:hypothetical protein